VINGMVSLVASEQDVPQFGEWRKKMVTAASRKSVRQVTISSRRLGRGDSSVEISAREVVAQHTHFHGRADCFEFQYRERVLVVRGAVPSYYLKQLLQSALMDLQGVSRVDNQVAVVACDGLSSVHEESATCTAE
jgi:hypothetical protein